MHPCHYSLNNYILLNYKLENSIKEGFKTRFISLVVERFNLKIVFYLNNQSNIIWTKKKSEKKLINSLRTWFWQNHAHANWLIQFFDLLGQFFSFLRHFFSPNRFSSWIRVLCQSAVRYYNSALTREELSTTT